MLETVQREKGRLARRRRQQSRNVEEYLVCKAVSLWRPFYSLSLALLVNSTPMHAYGSGMASEVEGGLFYGAYRARLCPCWLDHKLHGEMGPSGRRSEIEGVV